MKTKIILLQVALFLATNTFSQLKIYTGGSISYGSTTAPGGGEKHKFTGDVVVTSTTATPSSALRLRGNNGFSAANTPDYTWYGNDQTGLFHPANNIIGFSTNGSERMRLTTNGNLLLGLTSDVGPRMVVNGASDGTTLLNYAYHTSDWGHCQNNSVNRSNTKGYRLVNTASGSEVETFVVLGWGGVYAVGYYNISDKNMKENVDSITNALDKVKQLKGVKYNLKQSLTGPMTTKMEIGLIAQDVEAVVPEVVRTNDKGLKGVAYQNLVALLIEAIKEQDKQITQLQSDVNNCCTKKGAEQNRTSTTLNETSTGYKGNSYIKQNAPNPFSKETSIDYFIAEKNANASILVFDMNGKLLKTYKINSNGAGNLIINSNELSPGMYYYSLIVNSKEIDTKKMILTE